MEWLHPRQPGNNLYLMRRSISIFSRFFRKNPNRHHDEYYNATTNGVTTTTTNVVTQKKIYGHSFSGIAYTTNASPNYVTLQLGADRVQTIYKDWSVKLHADGQWANGALISNEQYAMGGTAGVRGYQDGQAYGDTGWRFSIEPQTPRSTSAWCGNEGHGNLLVSRLNVRGLWPELFAGPAVPGGPAAILLGRGLGRDLQYRQPRGRAGDGGLAVDRPCR